MHAQQGGFSTGLNKVNISSLVALVEKLCLIIGDKILMCSKYNYGSLFAHMWLICF